MARRGGDGTTNYGISDSIGVSYDALNVDGHAFGSVVAQEGDAVGEAITYKEV